MATFRRLQKSTRKLVVISVVLGILLGIASYTMERVTVITACEGIGI